jgi:putative membrane protein
MEFLTSSYLVLKSLHLIAVICWMAAMLYLPRLFIYHAQSLKGSQQSETFKVMERRLARIIMTPAMVATFIFGILLALIPGTVAAPNMWFHLKLLFVLILAGLHGYYIKLMKDFERDQTHVSVLVLRVLNETTTLFMIFIIFLVVMKPF